MAVEPVNHETVKTAPMLKTLDIHIVDIGETYAVAEVTVNEFHRNCFGGAHGGLIAALIDTSSFYPEPILPSGRDCTTTNLNVNYVRPAMLGDKLIARSEIASIGKRMATVRVDVHNANKKMVAHGTVTIMFTS
jgi:acyl-CoA thioesterase